MAERMRDLLIKLIGKPIGVLWSNGMFSITPFSDRMWKIESVGEDFIVLLSPKEATQGSGAYAISYLRCISAELLEKKEDPLPL